MEGACYDMSIRGSQKVSDREIRYLGFEALKQLVIVYFQPFKAREQSFISLSILLPLEVSITNCQNSGLERC